MRPRLKKLLLLGGLSLFVLRWVTQRVTAHDVTHSAAAGIGPLRALVAVGVMTAAPVLAARPVMGSSGLILGGAVGGSLTFRTAHTHTDVTVGAIGFHRLVEGISLAAVLDAGSVIGAVGFVVISGHTIVECTAIGGHPGLDRRRAVAAVVLIESVFVAGVFLGAVGVTTAAVPVSWLSTAVGSVLLMVGVDETGLLNQA